MLQNMLAYKKISMGKFCVKNVGMKKLDVLLRKLSSVFFNNRKNDIIATICYSRPVNKTRKFPIATSRINNTCNIFFFHKSLQELYVLLSVFYRRATT